MPSTGEDAWEPDVLDLPLLLIRGDVFEAKYSLPDDYGWGEVASDLKVERVSGTHWTMFQGQHLGKLTRAFGSATNLPADAVMPATTGKPHWGHQACRFEAKAGSAVVADTDQRTKNAQGLF